MGSELGRARESARKRDGLRGRQQGPRQERRDDELTVGGKKSLESRRMRYESLPKTEKRRIGLLERQRRSALSLRRTKPSK